VTACGGPCSEKEAQEVALAVAPTIHPIGSRNMPFHSSPGHKAFRPAAAAVSSRSASAGDRARAAAQEGGRWDSWGFGGKNSLVVIDEGARPSKVSTVGQKA
jgi:hypothetical protein